MTPSIHTTRTAARAAAIVALTVSAALLAWPALSSAAALKLPKGVSAEAAERMYAEQVDSQANIEGLVEGRLASFTVTGRTVRADSAELQVRVADKTGAVRRGIMKFVKADGRWYFSSITRTEAADDEPVALSGRYDTGILNTILAEQQAHSATTAKLVDGTYSEVTIGKPKPGYRSVVLPVTFRGKAKSVKPAAGEITAVKRTKAGDDSWFIVSFDAK